MINISHTTSHLLYSDPHRYSAAASAAVRRNSNDSAAAAVDKKESPLTRGSASSSVTAAPQPSPPVKEKPADFQNNSVLTSEHKVQHRRTNTHQHKDSSTATVTRTSTSPTKSPASPAGTTVDNFSYFLYCYQLNVFPDTLEVCT